MGTKNTRRPLQHDAICDLVCELESIGELLYRVDDALNAESDEVEAQDVRLSLAAELDFQRADLKDAYVALRRRVRKRLGQLDKMDDGGT
jgi:hypothetical protein